MYKIADAHCDFLSYKTLGDCEGRTQDHLSLPSMLEGGISLQNFAIWIPADNKDRYADCKRQIEFLCSLGAKHSDVLIFVNNSEDYKKQPEIKAVLSIEGGESIDCSLERIDEVYNSGARILSLTWNHENEFAHGCTTEGGIKELGLKAIRKMNKLKMSLDVSHLSEQSFWDAAGAYDHPLCATHSCVYELCEHPRNLKKDQIRHIINSGGFIGINFYPVFLTGGQAKLSDVIRHIEYIIELGGEDAVGFGSDFCGIDHTPMDLCSASDFQKLPMAMELRGYDKQLIEKICCGNFERFILKFL